MEAPGAGEPEPRAAGPGQEIDLSLDDIIRRQRQAQPNRKPWQQRQLKTRHGASGDGKFRFQSRGPPTLPGFPQGFSRPPWARKPSRSRISTPGPRAAGQMQGRSPLNRPAFAQKEKSGKIPPDGNGVGASPDSQPAAAQRAESFKAAGVSLPFQRPFRLKQGRPFLQSQIKFNFNKRQIKSKTEQKLSRARRPGARRPFLRRWNRQTPQLRRQPRGVMLRFNFRAMANQTSMTLNERFSGLRHKRHFVAERNASRMVILP